MRNRVFLNRFLLIAICVFVLHAVTGCERRWRTTLYYEIPRTDGGFDNVQIYMMYGPETGPDYKLAVAVNGREALDAERGRILGLIYIPPTILTLEGYQEFPRDNVIRFDINDPYVTSPAFGDPSTGIRPKS